MTHSDTIVSRAVRASRPTAAALLLHALPVVAQSGMMERDSSLNNLVHAPGYVTAPPGALGNVVRKGTGTVDVVLIPGWGFGAAAFDEFMTANATRYRMVAVTLPGFGGTQAPPMPPAGTSYAEGTWTRAAERAIADLIRKEGLHKPVTVGNFIVGAQMAFRLATDYPDLVGGVVSVGAEPMRFLPSMRDSTRRTPAPPDERARVVDKFAADWYRIVTRRAWDFNNYRPPQYAINSARAGRLWRESAAVPMPVMIRYLCEYMAQDLTGDFVNLRVPAKALVPGFSQEIFADSLQRYVKTLVTDAWEQVRRLGTSIDIVTVPAARYFIQDDRPDVVRDAIDAVAAAARARRGAGRVESNREHSSARVTSSCSCRFIGCGQAGSRCPAAGCPSCR